MATSHCLTRPYDIQRFIQSALSDASDAPVASLTSGDAQMVLDEIWKVLSSPVLSNATKNKIPSLTYRNKLRKVCLKVTVQHGILPGVLILKGVKTIDNVQRAAGGFADVFCGTYGEGKVGLKRLRVYLMSTDTQKTSLRKAFYRESILWKGLSHEAIVPFLGVTEDLFDGTICMVLPWYDNGCARAHLDRMKHKGDLSSDELLGAVDKWLYQTALGLEYLHDEGIVHGDVHAGNILIDDKENARITDFGMSLIAEGTAYNYASMHGGGALRWQAPELIDPEEFNLETSRPTTQSDVFSIACTAIELYSGRPPFPELADHQVSKRYIKGNRPPRPLLLGNGPGLMPHALWMIVKACWAQDRSQRPSARDVANRLYDEVLHLGRKLLPSQTAKDRTALKQLPTLYSCTVVHDCEPSPRMSYHGLPFLVLRVGEVYDVLRELGPPQDRPDLPLHIEVDDVDCLLLLRSSSREVGYGMAGFLYPV